MMYKYARSFIKSIWHDMNIQFEILCLTEIVKNLQIL